MGVFSGIQSVSSDMVYGSMRGYLKRDENVHVIMLNSFSKWINKSFQCEDKYTTQVDNILSSMQNDGYEILDVKFNSLMNQGVFGEMEGFHTLITYRFRPKKSTECTLSDIKALLERLFDTQGTEPVDTPASISSEALPDEFAILIPGEDSFTYRCSACGTKQPGTRLRCFQCARLFRQPNESGADEPEL